MKNEKRVSLKDILGIFKKKSFKKEINIKEEKEDNILKDDEFNNYESNECLLTNSSNNSYEENQKKIIEKDKITIIDSQTEAILEILKNIELSKMLIGNKNGNFLPNLYTISFETVLKDYSKEFSEYLKKSLNYTEWYIEYNFREYITSVNSILEKKKEGNNVKNEIKALYHSFFFEKNGNKIELLNFDPSYFEEIKILFEKDPTDPNMFVPSQSKVIFFLKIRFC
jgi:hypothetical protein